MILFIFTGFSGAGKSTITKAISQALKLSVIEERKITAELTKQAGYQRTRDWMETIGTSGVRDRAAQRTVELIQEQVAQPGFVIHIHTTEANRRQRVTDREGTPAEQATKEMEFIDGLKLAAGMMELITKAHFHIENNGPLDHTIALLTRKLESELAPTSSRERKF